jgi:hypothetical protein
VRTPPHPLTVLSPSWRLTPIGDAHCPDPPYRPAKREREPCTGHVYASHFSRFFLLIKKLKKEEFQFVNEKLGRLEDEGRAISARDLLSSLEQ